MGSHHSIYQSRRQYVVIWLATTQHSRRLLNAYAEQSQKVQNTEPILQQKHTIYNIDIRHKVRVPDIQKKNENNKQRDG